MFLGTCLWLARLHIEDLKSVWTLKLVDSPSDYPEVNQLLSEHLGKTDPLKPGNSQYLALSSWTSSVAADQNMLRA